MTTTAFGLRKAAVLVCANLVGGACTDQPPPTSPENVTVLVQSLSGRLSRLTWLRYQDGDGAWSRVEATTPGLYHLPVTGPRFAIATVCEDAGGLMGEIIAATREELTELNSTCPDSWISISQGRAPSSTRGKPRSWEAPRTSSWSGFPRHLPGKAQS